MQNGFPPHSIPVWVLGPLFFEEWMLRKKSRSSSDTRLVDGHSTPFPVWHPFLPFNLLRHTQPAAVPFKRQPLLLLRSNFHVNKCSQVGVAMAISPWLPWRRDRGGTGSRFAVDSWSPLSPFPVSFFLFTFAQPNLLEHDYKSAICVHLRSCVTRRNWIVHKSASIWPGVLARGSLWLRADARRCKLSDGEWVFCFHLPGISAERSIHHKFISHKCASHDSTRHVIAVLRKGRARIARAWCC